MVVGVVSRFNLGQFSLTSRSGGNVQNMVDDTGLQLGREEVLAAELALREGQA